MPIKVVNNVDMHVFQHVPVGRIIRGIGIKSFVDKWLIHKQLGYWCNRKNWTIFEHESGYECNQMNALTSWALMHLKPKADMDNWTLEVKGADNLRGKVHRIKCIDALIKQDNTCRCTKEIGLEAKRQIQGGYKRKIWAVATILRGYNMRYLELDLRVNLLHGLLYFIKVYVSSFLISMLSFLLNIGNRSNVIVIFYFFHSVRPPDNGFCNLNLYFFIFINEN